jgi:hypothetical protein
MPSLFLKKGRAAPLAGNNVGPIIGVLKLGLALATIGVLGKLTAKLTTGPKAPGFGGSSFAGPGAGNRPLTAASAYGRQGPGTFRSGPSTPRPRQ